MTYEEWVTGVPEIIKQATLWRVEAYRLSLFLSVLARRDVTILYRDRRTSILADQLLRAADNVSSSIAEGYCRGTGKGRSIFYEYSFGSVREARDRYYKGRCALKQEVLEHRLDLCTRTIRLLITMIARERRSNLKIATWETE